MFGENRADHKIRFSDGTLETPGKGRSKSKLGRRGKEKIKQKKCGVLVFCSFFSLPVALQLSAELMRSCSSINSMFG